MIKDSAEPNAEPETLSIGINSVTTLEITRQTIKIPVIIHHDTETTEMALIDSGAGGNFIDIETVTKLQLARIELRKPILVRNVDGTHNITGHITHRVLLNATIAGQRQTLSLLITGIGHQNIILGLPWLISEDPDINWKAGTLKWRLYGERRTDEGSAARMMERLKGHAAAPHEHPLVPRIVSSLFPHLPQSAMP